MEFDNNRGVVKIKQNTGSFFLGVTLPSIMLNCVNDRELWGIPARCIKLSSAPTDRKFYGHCEVYWARSLEFEIDRNTWDREILDEGNKVLHGHWNTTTGEWTLDNINGAEPDEFNPEHFDQFKDKNGENCRVVLNGHGLPSGVVVAKAPSPTKNYIRISSGSGTLPTVGAVWVTENGGDTFWYPNVVYSRGNIVVLDAGGGVPGDTYIATLSEETAEPPLGSWVILPDGVNDKGEFDATVTYNAGDRVSYPVQAQVGGKEPAGSIIVQNYDECNFLLLGIPSILG